MSPLSAELDARSRKNLDSILKSIAAVDQKIVAEPLGKDESTIAKMKEDGRIEQFALILAVLDLKVVATNVRCVDTKTLEILVHGHRKWVESISQPEHAAGDSPIL